MEATTRQNLRPGKAIDIADIRPGMILHRCTLANRTRGYNTVEVTLALGGRLRGFIIDRNGNRTTDHSVVLNPVNSNRHTFRTMVAR